MADYDLVVRGGTVVTGADVVRADVGIRDGRIAAIGDELAGDRVGCRWPLVLPGGVDTHCHIEQLQEGGGADEETWLSPVRPACLAGGTTSVVTFSAQFKGWRSAGTVGRIPAAGGRRW